MTTMQSISLSHVAGAFYTDYSQLYVTITGYEPRLPKRQRHVRLLRGTYGVFIPGLWFKQHLFSKQRIICTNMCVNAPYP